MYDNRRKALPWISGPEETRTNDHWGAHPRPNYLSYPSELTYEMPLTTRENKSLNRTYFLQFQPKN